MVSEHGAPTPVHVLSPAVQLRQAGCIENRGKKSLLPEVLISNRLAKMETRNSGQMFSSLGLVFL